MIAVICVIIALLGLLGPWPIIDHGFWKHLTTIDKEMVYSSFINAPQTRLFAWKSPDGVILIIIGLLLFSSLMYVTRPWLLKTRRVVINLLALFYFLELFTSFIMGQSLDVNMGLLFTTVNLIIGAILSFTDIGSKQALVSTQMGKPQSEMGNLRKTVTDILQASRRKVEWLIINSDIPELLNKKIEEDNLKIGRDPNWANLVIPEEYNYVSRRHVVLTPQLNGVIIQFRDAKYAMKVNGQLIKPEKGSESIASTQLDIEVVGGWGPKIGLEVNVVHEKSSALKTIPAVSNVLMQRYRYARFQIKFITVFMLFVILGLGAMMSTVKGNLIAEIRYAENKIEQDKKQIAALIKESTQLQKELEGLQAKKKELETKVKKLSETNKVLIDSLEKVNKTIVEEQDVGKTLAELQQIANDVGKLLLQTTIKMAVIELTQGRITGTIWLGKIDNNLYLFTAAHVVYPERFKDNITSSDIVNGDLILYDYFEEKELMRIPREKFNVIMERDIAYLYLGEIEDKLKKLEHFILNVEPEMVDSVIVEKKLVTWAGYAKGIPSTGAIGLVQEVKEGFLYTTIINIPGTSGGPVYVVPNEGDTEIYAIGIISGYSIFGNQQAKGRIAMLPESLISSLAQY